MRDETRMLFRLLEANVRNFKDTPCRHCKVLLLHIIYSKICENLNLFQPYPHFYYILRNKLEFLHTVEHWTDATIYLRRLPEMLPDEK